MTKAEKGDLIRVIKKESGHGHEIGAIVEVAKVTDSTEIFTGEWYMQDSEYEIFRKAGEEDSEPVTVITDAVARYNERTLYDAQLTQANRIRSACSELAELLVRKNHDYGDSFSKQYEKYGLMSALIRMDDKMRRLETLQAKGKAQVDESIADSLLDLAGYALLSYVEQTKNK